MSTPSLADDEVPNNLAALESRRAALFEINLNNPRNLDAAFEYAMISAELGDYEAAISTLERMLVFAPGLPRVHLELAALFYRIGAIESARFHLNEVSQQELPPVVRSRVNEFSVALDREAKPSRWSGELHFGLQGHTNANLAPNQESIIIGGLPVTLNPSAQAQSDINAFGLAQLHYLHDLGAQGALLEVDTTLYATRYADLGHLDMNLIEVAAGPSFNLGRFGWDKTRLGIYGILGAATLGGSEYSRTLGLGTRLRTQVGERSFLDVVVDGKNVDYSNSANFPTASLQSGEAYRAKFQLTSLLNTDLMSQVTFEARSINGQTDFKTYDAFALSARLNYSFTGPTNGIIADNAPWTLSTALGGLVRDFKGPDPLIDPANSQSDGAYWVEASIGIPLEKDFSVYVTGQYLGQNSNYATRDYEGAILTIGVSKRF